MSHSQRTNVLSLVLWHGPAAVLAGAALHAGAGTIDTSAVPPRYGPSALAAGWEHGAFMEVFVRAYQDSDGDGIGDLRGLTSRLDYLKDLGIKGLWLMPLTRSADGDHGYATTDFRAIEPAYGTLADFDELLKQAHRRGIGVVMDYVINHASARHPMFNEALKGPDNPFHAWFVWSQDAPPGWDIWGKYPWYHTASEPWRYQGDLTTMPRPPAGSTGFYFGTFGPHMPDFDFRHPAVLAYHEDSLRFWLNRGLDGVRLDAAPHLVENSAKDWNDQPQSRALVKRVQDLVRSYPRRYVVCEATAQPQDYGDPAVCGGAFAFGYVQHFVKAAMGDPASVRELAAYFRTARSTMATFVSNHDIFGGRRLWDQVDGDPARYKLAAAAYLLQPGTPFIYYGEEVGQASLAGMPGDEPVRGPMSWTSDTTTAGFTAGMPFRPVAPNVATHNAANERRNAESIHAFYKSMLRLRNGRPSVARGGYERSFADGLVLGFERRLDTERTLVVVNYGDQEVPVLAVGLPALGRLSPLFPVGGPAVRAGAGGRAHLWMPARSIRVWDIGRPHRAP